jgi:hypothetical protein
MSHMKSLFLSVFLLVSLFGSLTYQAQAQVSSPAPTVALETIASPAATFSAEVATESAVSTPAAEVIQKIQEKKDQDITETEGRQKSKLLTYLEQNPPAPLSWNNFLEHAIRYAISQGVPANVIVLVVLFPLIASFIAASRHVIGLRGFGIYIPAVLSVALVSTGIMAGILIFMAIISVAVFSKRILRHLTLSYLPRTAMLIWLISLTLLGVFLLAPVVNLTHLLNVNIFPILILVLLSENFLDAQSSTKQSDAFALAAETLGLAFVSGFILRLEFMQQFALVEPELLIILTAVFNILVGKFVGLRLTEWLRFRPIIEE